MLGLLTLRTSALSSDINAGRNFVEPMVNVINPVKKLSQIMLNNGYMPRDVVIRSRHRFPNPRR
jgi:hypothetical protein